MTTEPFSVPRGLMDGRFAAAMSRSAQVSATVHRSQSSSLVERIRSRLGMSADASVKDMLAEVDRRAAAKRGEDAAPRVDPGADFYPSARGGDGLPPLTAAEASLMRAAGWEA